MRIQKSTDKEYFGRKGLFRADSNIEKSKGFMGGGNKMMDKAGNKVLTPNLTPHETGIGNWTEAEFARTITNGINKDMNPVTYPMPLYPELTETEISAIFAYLQSIPPIKNEVKKK
ncbi:MAG: hypothetical protein JJU02_09630 [Cryomorphaceae bacterium]|nr:hypothetical protein [Cryomorphaceae bacterium]